MQLSLYIVNSKNPASLKALQNVKYFVFQREKGNDTGTEHFQLYVEFDMGKKFEVMKKNFPTAHIESRKGSKTQAHDYCCKNDTRMGGHQIYEYGKFTKNRERSDLSDITQMIESGTTDRDIQLAYPSQFFRYYKNIAQLRQVYLKTKFNNVFRELEIIYIYGLTEKRQNALCYGQVQSIISTSQKKYQ